MKKLLLIINPKAGRQQAKGFLLALVELFYRADYECTVIPTRYRALTIETVAASAQGYDLVVCCGGDGTFNEVVNGLMACPVPPPLGYVPSGTTNDLAISLGIPRAAMQAAEGILAGHPCAYDIGRFNGRYFSYVAAFGAFTEVSYQTSQAMKRTLGHMAYVLEGMKCLPELRPYRLRVTFDGQVVEGDYVFGAITNSTSIAGLFHLRADEVAFADGIFEVMLVKSPQNVVELQRILTGLATQNYDPDYLHFFHTAALTVESLGEPLAWSIDGEDGQLQAVADIQNIHGAVRILLSPDRGDST